MEPETPQITGSYRTSMGEYLRNVPELSRGTRVANGFGAVALLLAILSLPDPVPVAIEVTLAIALVSGYFGVPFTWLMLRSRRHLIEQPIEVVADGAGIRFIREGSTIDIPWEEIVRLRDRRDSFFVMARNSRAYILPKRALDTPGLGAFTKLAAAKGKLGRG